VAALLGWGAFAWYVFWQATAGTPLIWTDSTSYATVAVHPLWSTGFWAGQRPPLVPFVLKLAGSSTAFVALQALVAVAAWGCLAWTVGRLVPGGWRRVLATWLVLGFATSTPITLWNRSVLSESLSMSFLALLVAGVIWAVRRLTWPRVGAVVVAAVGFATTRDAQIYTVALVGVGVGVFVLVRGRHRPWLVRRAGTLALGLVVVAALFGWDAAHTGRNRQNAWDVLVVRIFPFPGRVAWFAAHGMPQARAIDRLAAATPATKGAAKVVSFDTSDPRYAALERWITNDAESTYILFLLTHPAYVVTAPLVRPELSNNFANGNLLFYAALDRVDSPLTAVLWPAWWWLLPMSVVAVVVAGVTGMWRRRSWRVIGALGALGVVAMLVSWHGDGQEVTRHTIEGFAEVRVGVLVLLVVSVLGESGRRRDARARSVRAAAGVGTADLGTADLGTADLGTADLGTAGIGTAGVGAAGGGAQADGGTAQQEVEGGSTAPGARETAVVPAQPVVDTRPELLVGGAEPESDAVP
jgi:hypothetical protein